MVKRKHENREHVRDYWRHQQMRSQHASKELARLLGPPRTSEKPGTDNPRGIAPLRADTIKSSMGF